MDIEQAKLLKVGQRVCCPADRGGAAYIGTVCGLGEDVRGAIWGKTYIWVEVKNGSRKAVWPSNRLALA